MNGIHFQHGTLELTSSGEEISSPSRSRETNHAGNNYDQIYRVAGNGEHVKEAAQGVVAALKELMLETRNLSRAVRDKVLVRDISVQVQPGEVLAVVGPSGAGKSSFLRLLNRLDEPTGGAVRLKGQDYRELAPRDLRRRVGMVMQMAYLFPGTVAANIAFGPRQRGERLAAEQTAALQRRVGLPEYQERDVSNLSGGEAQRVSVARTLANAPEALLLDEPTSALDDVSARGIEELVLSIIRERRMTCVIVTHNTAQAHRIADRTMVLEAGKLVAIGPTKEVLRDR
jgi:ABC-type proline/glycine betaine transport system ATPase subunit